MALLSVDPLIPWQYFTFSLKLSHFCPAVALNRRFLLASQSCLGAFNKDVKLLVYPAFPSEQIREELGLAHDVPRVKKIIKYDKFRVLKNGEVIGDLALVRVKGLDMARGKLSPICLPSQKVGNKVSEMSLQYLKSSAADEENGHDRLELDSILLATQYNRYQK